MISFLMGFCSVFIGGMIGSALFRSRLSRHTKRPY